MKKIFSIFILTLSLVFILSANPCYWNAQNCGFTQQDFENADTVFEETSGFDKTKKLLGTLSVLDEPHFLDLVKDGYFNCTFAEGAVGYFIVFSNLESIYSFSICYDTDGNLIGGYCYKYNF
jgi:hypothetical protein